MHCTRDCVFRNITHENGVIWKIYTASDRIFTSTVARIMNYPYLRSKTLDQLFALNVPTKGWYVSDIQTTRFVFTREKWILWKWKTDKRVKSLGSHHSSKCGKIARKPVGNHKINVILRRNQIKYWVYG